MVTSQLQTALTCFKLEFSNQLNLRFQTFYQRSCRRSNIVTQHNLWADELKLLEERMKKVWDGAIEQYDQIPQLACKERVVALSSMLQIESIAFQLMEKCRTLAEILKNPQHQQALIYYKEQVKRCESFVGQAPDVETFVTLFDEVNSRSANMQKELDKEPASVKDEVNLLYGEILKYIVYTARSFGLDFHPPTVVMPGEKPSETFQAVVSLPTENYFRNGRWFANSRWVGYPEIYTECMALQQSAMGIYQIETNLKKRVEVVATTDMDQDEILQEHTRDIQTLCSMEEAIDTHWCQLTKKPLSNQIHPGWYYAAALIAQAKWLHRDLTMVDSELLSYSRALNILRGEPSAQALDAAIKQLPKPTPTYERVHAVITTIFQNQFALAVTLVGEETTFAKEVLSRTLRWRVCEEELKPFLMKGFLHPTPEFRALLFRLEHDPLYCADFKDCLARSPELQSRYIKVPENDSLKTITDVLMRLYEHVNTTLYERFVRLHKAFQVFRGLEASDPYYNWFRSKLEEFKKSWSEVITITEEVKDQLLYKQLFASLFGTDPEMRKAADAAIVLPKHLEPGIIKVLAYRWVLERHMARGKLSTLSLDDVPPIERDILTRLFKGYVAKPAFWIGQYDMGYMEVALFKFNKFRGEPLNQLLQHYIQFRRIVKKGPVFLPNSEAYTAARGHYNEAQAVIEGQKWENHLQIARDLCTEMKEFLYHGRIFHT